MERSVTPAPILSELGCKEILSLVGRPEVVWLAVEADVADDAMFGSVEVLVYTVAPVAVICMDCTCMR